MSFNSTHYPRARKSHICDECSRAIEPGEHYSRTAAVSEGDFFTNVACLHCAIARLVVIGLDDYYSENFYHGLREWLADNATEWLTTARLAVGVSRKWQRFDGKGLMSLTTVPRGTEAARVDRHLGHILAGAA